MFINMENRKLFESMKVRLKLKKDKTNRKLVLFNEKMKIKNCCKIL